MENIIIETFIKDLKTSNLHNYSYREELVEIYKIHRETLIIELLKQLKLFNEEEYIFFTQSLIKYFVQLKDSGLEEDLILRQIFSEFF